MLITNKYLVYFGYTLFFGSYILYGITIPSPLFGLDGTFTGSELIISSFEYNILTSIETLVNKGEHFAVFLLYIFTYVIPIGKFIAGFLSLWQLPILKFLNRRRIQSYTKWVKENKPLSDLKYEQTFSEKIAFILCFKVKAIEIVRAISKYQFVDSFLAMFLVSHLMDAFVIVTVLRGGYYFWSYCLVSLVAAQLVSVGQIPVTKNMLFHHDIYTYHIDNESISRNHSINMHQGPEEMTKPVKNSINFKLSIYFIGHISVGLIMIGGYIYWLNSNLLVAHLHVLEHFSIAKSTLTGIQILNNLLNSPYVLNGFLTFCIFVISLPIIHMIFWIVLHSYIFFNYIKSTKSNQDELINGFNNAKGIKNQNLLFGKKDFLNEFDYFLYNKIAQYPKWIKIIYFFDHVGDWGMIDVVALSTIATWFTLNSLPYLFGQLPHTGTPNGFFMTITLGFTGTITVRLLSSFNHRLTSYLDYDFEYYQNKYNICGFKQNKNTSTNKEGKDVNNITYESQSNNAEGYLDPSSVKTYNELKNFLKYGNKNIGIKNYVPLFNVAMALFALEIVILIATITISPLTNSTPLYTSFHSLNEDLAIGIDDISEFLPVSNLGPMLGNCHPDSLPQEHSEFNSDAKCFPFPLLTYNEACCFDDQEESCECTVDSATILDPLKLCETLLGLLSDNAEGNTSAELYQKSVELAKMAYPTLKELFNIEFYQFFNLHKLGFHTLKIVADNDGLHHLIIALTVPKFSYHIGQTIPFEDVGSIDNNTYEMNDPNKFHVVQPYDEFIIGFTILMGCEEGTGLTSLSIGELFFQHLPLTSDINPDDYESPYIFLECLLNFAKGPLVGLLNDFLSPYLSNEQKIIFVTDTYYSVLDVLNFLFMLNAEDPLNICMPPEFYIENVSEEYPQGKPNIDADCSFFLGTLISRAISEKVGGVSLLEYLTDLGLDLSGLF